MAAKPGDGSEIFRAYVQDRKILIADGSATSRANLASTLVQLGAKSTNVAIVSNLADAEAEIIKLKPQIVICDYDLGNQRGLELLQKQRAESADAKKSLFILVTGNTSQTAVARAAEEDVDNFLLKPFTSEVLRNTLIKTAMSKMKPSGYATTIEEGKVMLMAGELDGALLCFEKATTLDPNPALAYFYIGQIKQMKTALTDAEGKYSEGLKFNKIHYKCMVGLFEVLLLQKRHAEAYDVAKRIAQYFPANPKRLNQILKLAILTRSYDDVEKYYQIFTKIDERAEDIVRHICAALVVCGKHYLQHNHQSRAFELFKKAAVTASGRTKILREIIQTLVEFGHIKETKEFLDRFPMDARRDGNFLAMELLVMDKSNDVDPGNVIAKGRKMIEEGGSDPLLYQIVINRSTQVGWRDAAEQLREKALAKFPEQAGMFPEIPPPPAKDEDEDEEDDEAA